MSRKISPEQPVILGTPEGQKHLAEAREWKHKRQAFLRTSEGQKHRAEMREWDQSLALRRTLGSSAPPVELPTMDMLRRSGALERVLDGIKTRLTLIDQRQREQLDFEVARCIHIANMLNWSLRASHEILGGEWAKYRNKSSRKPGEALRFVFLKVHSDPKKASFYYNATRVLFEERVKPEDLSRRITEGGGYSALAKANVRFPRPKKTTGVGSGTTGAGRGTDTDGDANGDDGAELPPLKKSAPRDADGKDGPTAPRGRESVPRPEAAGGDDDGTGMVLIANFKGDGHEFLQLPVGCHASVCLVVTANDAGRRVVTIFSAVACD